MKKAPVPLFREKEMKLNLDIRNSSGQISVLIQVPVVSWAQARQVKRAALEMFGPGEGFQDAMPTEFPAPVTLRILRRGDDTWTKLGALLEAFTNIVGS